MSAKARNRKFSAAVVPGRCPRISPEQACCGTAMRAFVVSEYAHPSKIMLTYNAPEPVWKPGSLDILIDIHSVGLNFFDVRVHAASSQGHDINPKTHGRFCSLRENIKTNPRVRLFWVLSLPEPWLLPPKGARISLATVCLGLHKVLLESESPQSHIKYSLYQMRFRSTRAPVRAKRA